MFQMKDTDAGLSLSLAKDPDPRNPRLVDDNLFMLVTWTENLGDRHAWATRGDFEADITPDMALILPLLKADTENGPVLVRSWAAEDPVAGFAFATHERLIIGITAQ